jgi:hypothetical protein
MKKLLKGAIIGGFVFLLSGCLYPQDRMAQNQVPYEDQLISVQTAVENFQADTGVLPIKNRDMDTSIYQKYPIDFNRLMPKYIQQPPGNSYESGGIYQYVLVNVEEKPEVKLIDLEIASKVRDLQVRLNLYRQEHGYPPFKDILAAGIYTLDYKRLGLDEPPYVRSPYTGRNLPLIINNEAIVFIDYSMDLYQSLQTEEHDVKPGEDIRHILHTNSFFVPAYSVPYTINNNEPVFLVK